MPQPLIIVGAYTRSAAQSAIRAGFTPWCIDLFADRDLQEIAATQVCPLQFFPQALVTLLSDAPSEAPVLLTGPLENEPDLLDVAFSGRSYLTSQPAAIRSVRDPMALSLLPATPGLRYCKTRTELSLMSRLSRSVFGQWGRTRHLLKSRFSGGGIGIQWWEPDRPIGPDQYLQQFVRGSALSAVYWADGWSCLLLGTTEQLIGESSFGATGFRYCGSIGPTVLSQSARAALSHLGVQLTQQHDLRGVFGVDLVMDFSGTLWPVEINPRYVSSIEVLERAESIASLSTTPMGPRTAQQSHRMVGKAIVYARRDLEAFDLYDLFSKDEVADVPQIGRSIPIGWPICSVFASGQTREECFNKLQQLTQKLYEKCSPNVG